MSIRKLARALNKVATFHANNETIFTYVGCNCSVEDLEDITDRIFDEICSTGSMEEHIYIRPDLTEA